MKTNLKISVVTFGGGLIFIFLFSIFALYIWPRIPRTPSPKEQQLKAEEEQSIRNELDFFAGAKEAGKLSNSFCKYLSGRSEHKII